jgi:hypothetical protein
MIFVFICVLKKKSLEQLPQEKEVAEKRKVIPSSPSQPKKRMKIAEGEEEELRVAAKDLVVASMQTPRPSQLTIPDQRNMTYIFCPEAREILPTQPPERDVIALLVPSTMLNSTQDLEPSLLEVQCQVLNLHIYPAH